MSAKGRKRTLGRDTCDGILLPEAEGPGRPSILMAKAVRLSLRNVEDLMD